MNMIFEKMDELFEANENSAIGMDDMKFAFFVANGCAVANLELHEKANEG